MKRNLLASLGLLSLLLFYVPGTAGQSTESPADANLREFVATSALSGYERPLADEIRTHLAAFYPQTDNLGNVFITLGSGRVRRLLVAPMDEPGYVVGGITPDGYLRLQRLPQNNPPALFDTLMAAQPVRVGTTSGKWINGVVAGLSIHLQPGRLNPPSEANLDEIYVDIGASSAADARKAGADVLSPVVLDRELRTMSYGKLTAPAIGDRTGVAALVDLVPRLDPKKLASTVIIAFVAQQWAGGRGLMRLLEEVKADELIYVGRLTSGPLLAGTQGLRRGPRRDIASGVLVGLAEAPESLTGFPAELQSLAAANKIPFAVDYSAGLFPAAVQASVPMPPRWAHLGIATAWPSTPAEMIAGADLRALVDLLEAYLVGLVSAPSPSANRAGTSVADGIVGQPTLTAILSHMSIAYGVSGHESHVAEAVKSLLPPWAKPETDADGNLILRVGSAPPASKTPRILFVAHMDEIGFEVRSIAVDGRLEVEWRGRGEIEFFAGHAALVHTTTGILPAVVELPSGWELPGFEWPTGPRLTVRVDVGARSKEEAEKLGVQVGSTVTIPKKYRPLVSPRASARSFDDRVGCTALISAAWALGGPLKARNVTFVFSTHEETGLLGAAAVAKRLAAEGRAPVYVFAIDTFVSSDSPLESKRFAEAELGKGLVVRAVDNSNFVPPELVERLVRMSRAAQIPVQYGVTGGGNDGSAFLRYGSIDVALGWPLRYSHSPAEVVDLRDVEDLARIVALLSKTW